LGAPAFARCGARAKAAAPKRLCVGGLVQPRTGGLRLGTPANFQMKFFYVCILHSENNEEHFYVGFTEDLQTRLKSHNAGQVPDSAKLRPWRIKTAIAFNERRRAIEFERYLKSASGRAFAKKRF